MNFMTRRKLLAVGGSIGTLFAIKTLLYNREDILEDDPESLFWVPSKRSSLLDDLKSKHFDLLIIGGGATGTGCALDAASRGLSVACVERGDWSAGTSSKSTKLVHGGVRYLEKAVKEFDWEQYKLVREALEERKTLLSIAPHLTDSLPIMIPLYDWMTAPYYFVGTKVYDLLAGRYGLESSFTLTRQAALRSFPLLKKKGLIGGLVYFDGQQDDARMNVSLAMTALRHEACMLNYVKVVELSKDLQGQIDGAVVQDLRSGDLIKVRAKGVINATGPYSDTIRLMDNPSAKSMIRSSSGVHIMLPEYYSPRDMGLIDPSTRDGRVLFFLPWQNNTLAGTTDGPGQESPEARPEDVDYILEEVGGYLDERVPVRRCDVMSAWAGLRPLVVDPRKTDTQSLVRNHIVLTEPVSKLITIAGGKWTTYRRMAEETIDQAVNVFALKPPHKCRTRSIRLLGAQEYSDTLYISLIQQFGYETDIAKHLAKSYGDRCMGVALLDIQSSQNSSAPSATTAAPSRRWPLSGSSRLIPSYPYTEAEIRWTVRYEQALTISDVLLRRTRLAFHNCRAAVDVIPTVGRVMAEELGWSEEELAKQETDAREHLKSMGLETLAVYRAESTRDQLAECAKIFSQRNPNGWLLNPHSRSVSLAQYLAEIHKP